MRFIDLTGRKFNRLLVLRLGPKRKGMTLWICSCDCGNEVTVRAGSLSNGDSGSCGCYTQELKTKHQLTHTAEYKVWSTMIQRCSNPKNISYPNYGGRGIEVCTRWKTFSNFISDIGRRPSDSHSIDRIDNDGPYSPENCRWATKDEQMQNRQDSKYITANGITKRLSEWADEVGINYITLNLRLHRGWSPERAIFTKVIPRNAL